MTDSKKDIELIIKKGGRKSKPSYLTISGVHISNFQPDDKQPVLFLVEQTNGSCETTQDTWYGYKDGEKWMGIAEDNEGWQEIAGKIISWAPFPKVTA